MFLLFLFFNFYNAQSFINYISDTVCRSTHYTHPMYLQKAYGMILDKFGYINGRREEGYFIVNFVMFIVTYILFQVIILKVLLRNLLNNYSNILRHVRLKP